MVADARGVLTGRRALVLGAGAPAGSAVALALARSGADVAVAAGSLDGDEVMAVRRAKRAIEALGRRSTEYAFDLGLGANVRVSTRQVAKEMGGLDLLVYAADLYLRKAAEETSDADWSRVLNVNLSGVFYACRAALKEMSGRRGTIITITSSLGQQGAEESAAYCAGRHGVVGLTRALALEYAGRGVGIYAVALQHSEREGSGGVLEAGSNQSFQDRLGELAVRLASLSAEDVPRYSGQVIALEVDTSLEGAVGPSSAAT